MKDATTLTLTLSGPSGSTTLSGPIGSGFATITGSEGTGCSDTMVVTF